MPRSLLPNQRARGVTAVLGPTNTGKTHLAIERLVAHSSGVIGLPLRLLAREVYNRVVAKVGEGAVALVTGEEKIKPERARYWVATVEAMPRDLDVAFVAVDEIQLATDLDRGHVFTDRILNHRGREETLLIGSATMRPLVEALIPGVNVVTRPRLSQLSFAGDKKISRLPPRSAIVAFSADEVYAIAELIRRHRGGAAVVLGALSPRTRNAQVELFEAGDVDYLVATDAVGMGLNLNVAHVAFAARQKYDGFQFRDLNAAELGQIAGRAGRHLRDGTFGSTGRCEPFDPETIDALENHRFEPVRIAQWRNRDLDIGNLAALQASLAETPTERGLTRALVADDESALAILSNDQDTVRLAASRAGVERLWEVCALPDYRKISPLGHADLVGGIFGNLMGRGGRIPADWFARQLALVDRSEGDIDTLSQRLAHVRTWAFVANRPDWLADPEHWQGVTRRIEDNLSDALHVRLAARFVDRRTSVLMRRLRENATMEAQITAAGDVTVEGQHVGHLLGFHFVPDPAVEGTEARAALRNAAAKALAGEIEARADRFAAAADSTIVLSNDGTIRWTGDPVAKLDDGDKIYNPSVRIVADEQLTGPARDKVDTRLKAWLKAYVVRLLGPALELENAADLTGLARGIAFQLSESLGILERSRVAQDLKSLDQAGRAALRTKGVRFGAYHVYMPALVKPGPRILAAQLWALGNGGLDQKGIDEIAHLAGSGRTSFPVDPEIAKGLFRAAGFRAFATRAVRVDILERLADLIRPAIAYRPGVTAGDPPAGAADGEGFVQTGAMTSLVGTSGEDFGAILKGLGYASEMRPGPAITVPLMPARQKAELPVTEPQSDTENDPEADVMAVSSDPSGESAVVEATDDAQELASLSFSSDVSDSAPKGDSGPSEEPAVPEAEASVPEAVHEPLDDDVAASPHDEPRAAEPQPDGLAEAPPADEVEAEAEPTTLVADAEIDEARAATPADLSAPEATDQDSDVSATHERQAASDSTVATDGAGDPDATAEPVLIEVWRLQRFQREHHPRQRPGRRPENRPGGSRRPDAPRRPEGAQRPDRAPRPDGEPRPSPDGIAATADVAPDANRQPGPRGPGDRGQDRVPGGGRSFGGGRAAGPGGRGPGGAFGRDRGPGAQRGAGGPPAGEAAGRDDRGRGPQRRDDRPRFEARPERRERQPDPNSPFAALAALKAQLEAKDRDGT